MAARQRARKLSSPSAVRATPTRVIPGANASSAASWPRAGSSLRRVRSPEAPKITNVHGGVRPLAALADSADFLSPALWQEDELPLLRRGLEQLVREMRLGERQALCHDRVDLARTRQVEQRLEILAEPLWV